MPSGGLLWYSQAGGVFGWLPVVVLRAHGAVVNTAGLSHSSLWTKEVRMEGGRDESRETGGKGWDL